MPKSLSYHSDALSLHNAVFNDRRALFFGFDDYGSASASFAFKTDIHGNLHPESYQKLTSLAQQPKSLRPDSIRLNILAQNLLNLKLQNISRGTWFSRNASSAKQFMGINLSQEEQAELLVNEIETQIQRIASEAEKPVNNPLLSNSFQEAENIRKNLLLLELARVNQFSTSVKPRKEKAKLITAIEQNSRYILATYEVDVYYQIRLTEKVLLGLLSEVAAKKNVLVNEELSQQIKDLKSIRKLYIELQRNLKTINEYTLTLSDSSSTDEYLFLQHKLENASKLIYTIVKNPPEKVLNTLSELKTNTYDVIATRDSHNKAKLAELNSCESLEKSSRFIKILFGYPEKSTETIQQILLNFDPKKTFNRPTDAMRIELYYLLLDAITHRNTGAIEEKIRNLPKKHYCYTAEQALFDSIANSVRGIYLARLTVLQTAALYFEYFTNTTSFALSHVIINWFSSFFSPDTTGLRLVPIAPSIPKAARPRERSEHKKTSDQLRQEIFANMKIINAINLNEVSNFHDTLINDTIALIDELQTRVLTDGEADPNEYPLDYLDTIREMRITLQNDLKLVKLANEAKQTAQAAVDFASKNPFTGSEVQTQDQLTTAQEKLKQAQQAVSSTKNRASNAKYLIAASRNIAEAISLLYTYSTIQDAVDQPNIEVDPPLSFENRNSGRLSPQYEKTLPTPQTTAASSSQSHRNTSENRNGY